MPWSSERDGPVLPAAATPLVPAMLLGMRGRCPCCGQGRLFRGFLRVAETCGACAAPLGRVRADDAPPYFTIFIAGHLLLPPVFWIEKAHQPPMWLHMAIWLPLFAVVCTLLLRPVKGATLAWMLRLGVTGDDPSAAAVAPRRGSGDD